MKRSLLIALVIIGCASMAVAQPGSIGVFADAVGAGCNIVDAAGLVQIHYLHVNTGAATASQWMIDLSAVAWTHLGSIMAHTTIIGAPITGVSIGYGGCFPGPIYLGYSNFFGSAAAPCSMITVVADPANLNGVVEMVDCLAAKFTATGGSAIINADGSCQCNVPVHETTWGGIKALY